VASNIAPLVVELVTEVVRIGMKEYSARRLSELDREQRQVQSPQPVPITEIGCPYCAIARYVAAAHLYLGRVIDRPELVGIYRELAGDQLDDAMNITVALPESIPNAELLGMLRSAKGLLDATSIDGPAVKGKLWSVANAAMYIAESKRYDKGALDGPRLPPA